MKLIVAIAGLTGVYLLALGSTDWRDALTGAAVASALALVYRPAQKTPQSSGWLALVDTPRYIGLIGLDVLKGTWTVALYVTGLRTDVHPGIIKIPYGDHSPVQLTVVMMAISLSPGSFVVDVNQDERYFLGHFIDIRNPDQLRDEISRKYMRVPGMARR